MEDTKDKALSEDERTKNRKFWEEAWDHEPTRAKVEAELYDYLQFLDTQSKVYCHITGDSIGKVNTDPEWIISEHDRIRQRDIEKAVAEAKEEWEEQLSKYREYMQHKADCYKTRVPGGVDNCTCGLDQLILRMNNRNKT